MKTKIIVTVGPASSDERVIEAFVREGVAGFRINFSHGEPRVWDEYVKVISEVASRYGVNVSIIGDLRGPQVRIGVFQPFPVKKGDLVKLVYGDKPLEEKGVVPVSVKKVFSALDVGDIVLLDDGRIRLQVYDVGSDEATLIALSDGLVNPRKTLLISGKELDLPVLTKHDVDCVNYAVSHDFTYLALSYVRSARDVATLRELLEKRSRDSIGIIAKIETRAALKNLSTIIREADASIVARGDLGMHFSLEEIPLLQRRIIHESIKYGKPVIVATQLLESMISSPQPTRSEIVDVMNAVKDYVDALLLTAETAQGKHPIEAVKWIKRIVTKAEKWIKEEQREPVVRRESIVGIRDRFAHGLVLMAENLGAKIIVYTKTGFMPTRLSRLRPNVMVFVGTNNPKIAQKLSIYYGIETFIVGDPRQEYDYEQGLNLLFNKLIQDEKLEYGDIVIETYGRKEEVLYVVKVVHII